MKILAIRGRNLASLYGDFELPLDVGPVAEAGVFSISGPTGSGKSTLMDALCLALYGETPRFDERGKGVRPGRLGEEFEDLIDANDKRNLLSRGTGEGLAEVDFEAVDGRRYRASWLVRRARGRPDGRFQGVTMTLRDLEADAALCSGVDEVRKRVQALVGYSFAEFRRAVVLPQFEFRAFLDADTDTRARILERVTGTEIYARISQKAHERAAAERTALAQLEADAARLVVLAPEERDAAEKQAKTLEQIRESARGEKGAAEADVRWHEEDAKLAAEVDEADTAVEQAEAAVGAAGERRRVLADVEGAQPLRGARDEANRTAGEHSAAVAKQTGATGEVAKAERALGEAETQHREAEEALRSCLDATEVMRPALERARALDVQIAELEPRLLKANKALVEARLEATSKANDLVTLERRLADEERARGATEAWLREREGERALAAGWPRWKKALVDHAELERELRRTEAALSNARAIVLRVKKNRDELATGVADREGSSARLESAAAEASRAATGDDLATLARRVKAAIGRRDQLVALRTLAEEVRTASSQRDLAGSEVKAAQEALKRLGAEKEDVHRQVAVAEGALTAAREALARIDAALSLEEHRAELVDGEPCALCGATEHPYAKDAPAQSTRKEQAAAVKSAEQVLKKLQREAETRSAVIATANEKARNAAEVEVRCARAIADAESRYALAATAVTNAPASAAAASETLATLASEAADAVVHIEAEQADALERAAAAEKARNAADAARRSFEVLRRQLGEAEVALERAAGDEKAFGEKVRGLSVRRDGIEAELETAVAFRVRWREEARGEPETFATECAAVVEAHAEQERVLRSAIEALAALGPQREGARTLVAERKARADDAEAVARGEGEALARVRAERGGVLGGKSVADVERGRADSERTARAALEASARLLKAGDIAAASARAVLEEADAAVATTEGKASAAASILASALAARGIDRASLNALLERDLSWIDAERKSLAALDAAVREQQAKRAERKRKLEVHGERRPASTLDEAQQRVAAADHTEHEAVRELAAVQVRLLDDDRNRTERITMEGDLTRQRAATDRWFALSTLIGAHDGRELRVFAQGLTLDALLRAANHHLASLAPRYVLQRVPRRDLDIQVVDGDLGNEVRGVNGLSGGESFLASLALALGLSSLSTRRTQARTLFIDEGFGTLDRDTLEQAMAAIDQLGSGQRTVGVISHVPELHERIGVKVTVERVSAGRSRLVLPEGTPVRESGRSTSRRAS